MKCKMQDSGFRIEGKFVSGKWRWTAYAALAIALMVAKGLGPDDFRVHHPGGALGARLRGEADA